MDDGWLGKLHDLHPGFCTDTILSGPLLEVDRPGEPFQHLLQMLEVSYYVHHGWVLHEYEIILEETYSIFYKHTNQDFILFYLKGAAFKSQNVTPSGLWTNMCPLCPPVMVTCIGFIQVVNGF